MTEREAIEAYFGRPDQAFDINEYKGPYGGMINVMGLLHKQVIISGQKAYSSVQEAFGIELDRWAFYHAMTEWAAEYTGTTDEVIMVGAHPIQRGTIKHSSSRYFCVPPKQEALSQQAN